LRQYLKLIPNGHDVWREEILFTFGGKNGDGPGQLTMDKRGNLYGATDAGGAYNCYCGTVFALLTGWNGNWNEKTLFSFNGKNGMLPAQSPILDSAGALYGTTFEGGTVTECNDQSGCGVVFKITP
jgi:hypothetical protein